MKIRIQGNFLRLRLSQSDVLELQREGKIEEHIKFSQNSILTYGIAFNSSAKELSATFFQGCIKVFIPEEIGNHWVGSEEVGLENNEYTNQSSGLKILVEKDFQCLHQRRNEDESDSFPNPLALKNEG